MENPASGMNWDHPIFKELELDSSITDHLRVNVKALRRATGSMRIENSFLTSIDFYLRGVVASSIHAGVLNSLAAGKLSPDNDYFRTMSGSGIGNEPVKEFVRDFDEGAAKDNVSDIGNLMFADPMRLALATSSGDGMRRTIWRPEQLWRTRWF